MTTAKPYTPQWYADLMDRTQSRYCEADMDQLRNAINELRADVSGLVKYAQNLEGENLQLNELCIDVRAENERLKNRYEEVLKPAQALRAENDQLRATASEWREVVEAMRAENERLKAQCHAGRT